MPERDDEPFLLRWSRRKQAGGAGTPVKVHDAGSVPTGPELPDAADAIGAVDDPAAVEAAASPQTGAGEAVAGEPETIPADLADVDVETLNYEADFTRFMKDDVPDALKKRALRQLWRSDPVLANLDGLNDYDDDFTDAALAVKVLETAHKIGRGFLDDAPDDADDGEVTGSEGGDGVANVPSGPEDAEAGGAEGATAMAIGTGPDEDGDGDGDIVTAADSGPLEPTDDTARS